MKSKPTKSKDDRAHCLTSEELNELEALETEDWQSDHERRKFKKSDKYKEAQRLAEKYKERQE